MKELQKERKKKLSPRELHGDPEPSGEAIFISSEDREEADKLLEKANEMIIQFVRPGTRRRFVYEDVNNTYNRVTQETLLAPPIGVALAFKKGDNVYVGWSRRNDSTWLNAQGFAERWMEYLTCNGVPMENSAIDVVEFLLGGMSKEYAERIPVEPLPFTKADARRVAVLRAMSDDILVDSKTGKYYTQDNKEVPADVQPVLRRVIRRALAYFKCEKIRNVHSRPLAVSGISVIHAAG